MISLLYVSAARRLFDEAALSALLAQCRLNNAARGVTGMLLYSDGNFMQVLEGDAATVEGLAAKIAQDPRHHAMKVMLRQPITQRQFDAWSMALRRLVDLPEADRGLCSSLLQADVGAGAGATPSAASRLLESFRRSMA